MNMRKKVIGSLLAVAMLLGTAAPCSAKNGFTYDVTTDLAWGTFTYGNGGAVLKIKMAWTEKHPTTGDVIGDTKENTRAGADNSVSVSRAADNGYEYTKASFWGYAGGEQKASYIDVSARRE